MGKQKQIRLYTKTPLVEYKEWVKSKYGKLENDTQRQIVFDEYYSIRNKNKFDILDELSNNKRS